MEQSLIGVVFVARTRSSQSKVLYQYPPPKFQDKPDSSQPTDKSYLDPTNAQKDRFCFGIDSVSFAKLMMPGDFLCNRRFELEIDAGDWEADFSGGNQDPENELQHDYIRCGSFPCDVNDSKNYAVDVDIAPAARVSKFNVVFCFSSRDEEVDDDCFWQASSQLSQALLCEESRCGYLSREIGIMSDIHHTMGEYLVALEVLAEKSPLCKVLKDLCIGLQRGPSHQVVINGCLLLNLSTFQTRADEHLKMPSEQRSLVLLEDKNDVQRQLPVDAASSVRRVVDMIGTTKSLWDMSLELALPVGTVQRIAQHLVYWRKARVVNVLNKEQKMCISPDAPLGLDSDVSKEFEKTFPACRLKLPMVLKCFMLGNKLDTIKQKLQAKSPLINFEEVVAWLIARNLIVQLSSFFHFIPQRQYQPHTISKATRETAKRLIATDPTFAKSGISTQVLTEIDRVTHDQTDVLFILRFIYEFVNSNVDEWSVRMQLRDMGKS